MRKKASRKNRDEFEKDAWLDDENNLRDPDRLFEFLIDLFETRDKLSKQELFKLVGGQQQFREQVAAAVLRFKQRNKSKMTVPGLICYVYFRLQFLLRESD